MTIFLVCLAAFFVFCGVLTICLCVNSGRIEREARALFDDFTD